jgi:hypothetical protein
MNCRFCGRKAKYLINICGDNPYICGLHKKRILNAEIRIMGIVEKKEKHGRNINM